MKMNIKTAEDSPSFFYELNANGENRFSFLLDTYRNDDHSRVTPEQEDEIADEIYKRLTCHEGLVEALEALMRNTQFTADVSRLESSQKVLDKAKG